MGDKEENPEALKIQGFWIFLCSYQCLTCGKQRLRNGVFANQMMSFEKDKEEPAVFFAKECELAEKSVVERVDILLSPGKKTTRYWTPWMEKWQRQSESALLRALITGGTNCAAYIAT